MRSGRNYAHLVAARLGADLVDATVSGATTETILRHPQRVMLHTFAPQVESVHAETDLVTVTVGGNDLGYLAGILLTALLGRAAGWWLIGPIADRIRTGRTLRAVTPSQLEAVTDGLVSIVNEVRNRAPQARVVLVDYLPVFTDSSTTGPDVPLTAAEIDHFRGIARELSAAYAEASRRAGADFVPAATYDQGHGAGSVAPWVSGFRLRALASSFHPTLAGMQAAADAISGRLELD